LLLLRFLLEGILVGVKMVSVALLAKRVSLPHLCTLTSSHLRTPHIFASSHLCTLQDKQDHRSTAVYGQLEGADRRSGWCSFSRSTAAGSVLSWTAVNSDLFVSTLRSETQSDAILLVWSLVKLARCPGLAHATWLVGRCD
jgi:hypothetical protein